MAEPFLTSLVEHWTRPGSSPIDWCERNYSFTPHIAEFVNTITNIGFVIVPIVCVRVWHTYALCVSKSVYITWLLFIFIGVSSAYFHATLSLLGQLLDELSILYLLMASYTLYTPVRRRPRLLRARVRIYACAMLTITALITIAAFYNPKINAYILFAVGFPAIKMLIAEVGESRERRVASLGRVAIVTMVMASLAWLLDRLLCPLWLEMSLAYLHGLWHVLIFVTGYIMQVLFCYFHAVQDMPSSKPVLRSFYGLPYVYCMSERDKTP